MITASLCILAELPGQETRSWEKLRFLIGDSRLFIVTWSLSYATLAVGNPSGSTNGQRTPVSGLYGNRFFECTHGCNFSGEFLSRTRLTGQQNARSLARVQVVTSWPPQFGSFLSPSLSLLSPAPAGLSCATSLLRFLIPRHDSRWTREHTCLTNIPGHAVAL